MKLRFFVPVLLSITAAAFLMTACNDDSSTGNPYIGTPCTCENPDPDNKDNGCEQFGVALPSPQNNTTQAGKIVGCEDLDMTGIKGGIQVCLRSIKSEFDNLAPLTYFPKGYCTIAAVSCEGGAMCSFATYGDVSSFDKCPEGTVMLDSTFNYAIAGTDSVIVNKICARACNSDSDCNGDGEISCINKGGHKFCYNEKNFEFLCNDKGADCSNIKFTDF